MPKTTFVNGNPAQGILGTVVTAEFLNAMNKHHHTGRDVDGEGALPYAADAGSADTYEITLNPALGAYIVGMPIYFKATNTNTGPSTLNVNGLGAVAIKKNVSSALVAGDIVKDQVVIVVYDGTNFQLINNGSAVDINMFAKNHVSSGYQKFPNGMIMQWGGASVSNSGTDVTFPISFPNACLIVIASGANSNQKSINAYGWSKTKCTMIAAATDGPYSGSYVAVGY